MINHLQNIFDHYGKWGWRGVPFWVSKLYYRNFNTLKGTSIWNEDPDLTVILDNCRPEWMNAVVDEYSFLTNVKTRNSVGAHSREWIENTFSSKYSDLLADTAYISANHFLEQADPDLVAHIDDVRDITAYPDEWESVPAHIVTNQAVSYHRRHPNHRMVVHYMQPHYPFYQRVGSREKVERIHEGQLLSFFYQLFRNEISLEDFFEYYQDNLRYVLDEVDVLLRNVDAESVLITSDHGQALGERFLYDHAVGVNHPAMRKVPCIKTTAEDNRTIHPPEYDRKELSDSERERQLEALGYA